MSLIDGLRRGDPAAIAELYRSYGRDVLRWVIRLGGPYLDADDVAQDVFVTAMRAARRFRGDSTVRVWLFGITRGVVANARRRSAFRRFLGLDAVPEPVDRHPGADASLARADARRTVQRLLDTLTVRQREVLVLVDLEDLSAPEAATILGIGVPTTYSRLRSARRAFARALDEAQVDVGELLDGHANVVSLRRPR